MITIWLWLTVCHGKSPFFIGKPSISMGHLYHGYGKLPESTRNPSFLKKFEFLVPESGATYVLWISWGKLLEHRARPYCKWLNMVYKRTSCFEGGWNFSPGLLRKNMILWKSYDTFVVAVDLGRSWFHHRKNLALALQACEWRQAEHEVVLEQWMRSADSGVCWLRRYATHFKNRNWQHGNIISEDIRWYFSGNYQWVYFNTTNYAGWWYTYPSEKYEFVNGKDDIPFLVWKIKFMFETTKQYVYFNMWVCSMLYEMSPPKPQPLFRFEPSQLREYRQTKPYEHWCSQT